jgi:hypothetical protein
MEDVPNRFLSYPFDTARRVGFAVGDLFSLSLFLVFCVMIFPSVFR